MEEAMTWVDYVHMAITLFGTAILGLLFTLVRSWLKKLFVKWDISAGEQEAILALTEGVEKVGEEYVLDLKRNQVNGKLTQEQREEARNRALEHAKSVAKGQGKDVLKEISKERAGHLIKLIINKVAKPKAGAPK